MMKRPAKPQHTQTLSITQPKVKYNVIDINTNTEVDYHAEKIPLWMLKRAVRNDMYLQKRFYKDGRVMWRRVVKEDYMKFLNSTQNNAIGE